PVFARAATEWTAAADPSDHRAAGRRDGARRDDAPESRACRVAARRRQWERRNTSLRAGPDTYADGCSTATAMDSRSPHGRSAPDDRITIGCGCRAVQRGHDA